jgi:putative lipase involved disintegration of autophagic bodies
MPVDRWNSVAVDVITTVQDQLNTNTRYTLATVGHSLGGRFPSLISGWASFC